MTLAELNRLAEELGIDVVGAAPAEPYEETERAIRERRARGLFADMRFTMAQPEVSCHPEALLPGARTVVSAALSYFVPGHAPEPGQGRLPRYTWNDRYAELRERLDALGRRLGGAYRVLVDENQHVDREGAARSGVGFYGKNTLIITRRYGSWVVLGTLVTDVEVERSAPLALDCGSCTRRAREPLPADAEPTVSLVEWLEASDDDLRTRYERLYFPRKDPRYLRRNALVALGNSGEPRLAGAAEAYLADPDPMLREHAEWALQRLAYAVGGDRPQVERRERRAPAVSTD